MALGGRGGRGGGGGGFGGGGGGSHTCLPGKYKVSISLISGGTTTKLAGPVQTSTWWRWMCSDAFYSGGTRGERSKFQKKAAKLSAAMSAAAGNRNY